MLMEVYSMEELDKLEDWIKKIISNNKIMETLHVRIEKLKDQTKEKIFEVEKYYNDACLHIFEDESKEKLISM